MEEPAEDVMLFIRDRIDTVPQIEALLLVWEGRPNSFTAAQVSRRLYVADNAGARILMHLFHRKLVIPTADGSAYVYDSTWDPAGEFMERVAATYRRHLIRVATLIHAKASPSVLEFARAFGPKKES